MLILGIILFMLSGAVFGLYLANETSSHKILAGVVFLLAITGVTIIAVQLTKTEVSVQCLKGNNPYKMEIRYELKDSIYVPIDTVYIKK